MVEEQVNPEIFPAHFERILASDEGESNAQFQQELSYVVSKSTLKISLMSFLREHEKVEVVRVLQQLLSEIRLGSRKRLAEIGQSLSLTPVESSFDLHHQDVPAPAIPYGFLNVPKPLFGIFHLV